MKVIRCTILILLIVSLTLLAGCTSKPDAKVIECSNIFFKCSDNNCENQCGKIATEKGKVLRSSESINDGSGCWCEYEDPENKIETESSVIVVSEENSEE